MAVWLYEVGNGWWKECAQRETNTFEKALAEWKSHTKFVYEHNNRRMNTTYNVNLAQMTQTNWRTGTVRRLARHSPQQLYTINVAAPTQTNRLIHIAVWGPCYYWSDEAPDHERDAGSHEARQPVQGRGG